MPERLETHGFVRAVDEERRRVTVVVSTGDVARDDAVIDQSGWDLRNYERNPVVLWAHNDRELPIARAVSSQVGANELVQVHEFATHPRAEEVWQAVRAGFVNATSVRWYQARPRSEGGRGEGGALGAGVHARARAAGVELRTGAGGCGVPGAARGRRACGRGAYAREGEAAAVTAETEQSPWQRFAARFTKCASEEAQR